MSSLQNSSGKSDRMKLLWNHTNKDWKTAERSREQIGTSSFRWPKQRKKIFLGGEEGLFCSTARPWKLLDSDLRKKESLIQEGQRKNNGRFVFSFFFFSLFYKYSFILVEQCLILMCFLIIYVGRVFKGDNTWKGKYYKNLLKERVMLLLVDIQLFNWWFVFGRISLLGMV